MGPLGFYEKNVTALDVPSLLLVIVVSLSCNYRGPVRCSGHAAPMDRPRLVMQHLWTGLLAGHAAPVGQPTTGHAHGVS